MHMHMIAALQLHAKRASVREGGGGGLLTFGTLYSAVRPLTMHPPDGVTIVPTLERLLTTSRSFFRFRQRRRKKTLSSAILSTAILAWTNHSLLPNIATACFTHIPLFEPPRRNL